MMQAVIFCTVLAVASGLHDSFPPTFPTSCAATTCRRGTICKEIRVNGIGVKTTCIPAVEKPGSCPVVRRILAFRRLCLSDSRDECVSDNECIGIKKCCNNRCGRRICRAPVTEPSTCDLHCPLGQKCVLQNVQCIRAPCPRIQKCVPYLPPRPVVKPGRCPAVTSKNFGTCVSQCQDDSDCHTTDKCCGSNGCGMTCTPAVFLPPRPSCTRKCPRGQKCELRSVQCFRGPCPSIQTCVPDFPPRPVVKPGRCPAVTSTIFGTCVNQCQDDSDCHTTDKCCGSNGCGMTCTPAVFLPPRPSCTRKCPRGQKCELQSVQCIQAPCPSIQTCVPDFPPKPVEKPGNCPAQRKGTVGICVHECQDDNHCTGDAKCCSTGCGTTCQAPRPSCRTVKCGRGQKCELEPFLCSSHSDCQYRTKCVTVHVPVVKKGTCPRVRPSYRFGRRQCREQCETDAECPGIQKCCQGLLCRGTTCSDPQLPLNCASMTCPPDQMCVMRRPQRVPRCVRKEPISPHY